MAVQRARMLCHERSSNVRVSPIPYHIRPFDIFKHSIVHLTVCACCEYLWRSNMTFKLKDGQPAWQQATLFFEELPNSYIAEKKRPRRKLMIKPTRSSERFAGLKESTDPSERTKNTRRCRSREQQT
jgi:hypothetical protein